MGGALKSAFQKQVHLVIVICPARCPLGTSMSGTSSSLAQAPRKLVQCRPTLLQSPLQVFATFSAFSEVLSFSWTEQLKIKVQEPHLYKGALCRILLSSPKTYKGFGARALVTDNRLHFLSTCVHFSFEMSSGEMSVASLCSLGQRLY